MRTDPARATPRHALRLLLAITVAVTAAACTARDEAPAASAPLAGGVVDSALPIPVLLERFRATIPDTPTVLAGGRESPERLVRDLLAAVTARDSATVRALVMSRAEFGWLYYPHTKFTAPPYELGPELVWIPLIGASEKGAGRLLARYGGTPLRFESLTCAESVSVEGPNEIRGGCRVRFAAGDSAARELRLFSSLLKRDGRYKFLSYANDL